MKVHSILYFFMRPVLLGTVVAVLLLLFSSPHSRITGARVRTQKGTLSNTELMKALVGNWRSHGIAVNSDGDPSENIDYSAHYRAEVKGDELVLTWVTDKDSKNYLKGDERVTFLFRFDGRRFTGRKNWDGASKTWGHVNENCDEMRIYQEKGDNVVTQLLKRER